MIVADIEELIWVPVDSSPAVKLGEGWLFVQVGPTPGSVGVGEAWQARELDGPRLPREQARARAAGPIHRDRAACRRASAVAANGRAAATAVSAVEQCLWDVWGKSLGQPIWALLGGRYRERIPLYANVNRGARDRSPGGFAERARGAVADGFRAVKCAPFDGVDCPAAGSAANAAGVRIGIERVAAIRAAVGSEIRVMVDCHGRFDVATALRVARELEGLGLAWLESRCRRTTSTGWSGSGTGRRCPSPERRA